MDNIYQLLQEKLDSLGFGYTATESGAEEVFLKRFFSPEDAECLLAFPSEGYHTAEDIALLFERDIKAVDEQLSDMAQRGLLFRLREGSETKYRLVPIAHGIFEFQLKNVEADWSKAVTTHYLQGWGKQFYGADVPIFRTVPAYSMLEHDSKVLPYDDVESILRSRKKISISDCICRKREEVRGKPCGHRMEACLQFNDLADFYIENDMGREISLDQALQIVREGEKEGLVVQVANSQDVEAICMCCSCACGLLGAIKYFPGPANKKIGNYICERVEENCLPRCQHVCVKRCPVGAFKEKEGELRFKQELCIGCGLCVSTCPGRALSLRKKNEDELYEPKETLFDTYEHIASYRREKEMV